MLRNCLDTHLGQIVCDKDGVVDWCIILVEIPLTRFKESWPLLMESLPELPLNLNIVTLTLTVWPIISGVFPQLVLLNGFRLKVKKSMFSLFINIISLKLSSL